MEILKVVIVPILVALISSGIVGAIGTAAAKRITKQDPKSAAMRLMLQDKIIYLVEKELARGYTTTAQHKMIRQMYQAYKDLDGNGDMDWFMAEYDRLHLQ